MPPCTLIWRPARRAERRAIPKRQSPSCSARAAAAEEREFPSLVARRFGSESARCRRHRSLVLLRSGARPLPYRAAALLLVGGWFASPLGHGSSRSVDALYYLQAHAAQSASSPLSEHSGMPAAAKRRSSDDTVRRLRTDRPVCCLRGLRRDRCRALSARQHGSKTIDGPSTPGGHPVRGDWQRLPCRRAPSPRVSAQPREKAIAKPDRVAAHEHRCAAHGLVRRSIRDRFVSVRHALAPRSSKSNISRRR